MDWPHYNVALISLAGKENVGWIVKDDDGRILKSDEDGHFARMVGLTADKLIGSTTAALPWADLKAKVLLVDKLVTFGESRETTGLYWHPERSEWRRVVSARWLLNALSVDWDAQAKNYICCMIADVTQLADSNSQIMGGLEQHVEVDWQKERVVVGAGSVGRADLICVSYYLQNTTQAEIAQLMALSVKTIENRIARLKRILVPLDVSCGNLYVLCRKYKIRDMLEEKRDWFDRVSIIRPIQNWQWK